MAETQAPPAYITGPLILGYLLNYGLLGILSVQTYLYYAAFPNDQKKFKVLVYFVYILEVTQTIMISHDAFERFVYGFANPGAISKINLIWFFSPFVDGLVAFLVQLQFAYRIRLLSPKSKFVLALILLASLTQFGGALGAAIIASTVDTIQELGDSNFVIGCIWLAGSAVADVTIAFSMIYVLSRYDRSFEQSDDLVRRIIRLTMETGSLTAIMAICQLVLFTAIPNRNYHMVPAMILAKVYSNSLMVVFNSRIRIAGRHSDADSSVKTTGNIGLNRLQTPRRQPEVRTQIETDIWRDPLPEIRNEHRSRFSIDSDGLNIVGADIKPRALS
ncbi:hypothetical protein Moror_3860 [Moniliophthora roreri MCA 2997]|uniref:DUF6534 domain-containing protein n=2 Tax=Moniliophthora roreri TaxID=221103 RepID=V2XNU0_MONRO|nr:hypothetical protein Moror_3860 [Moniliophthora roreri MCA 2997]KAI3611395.1 hypothetical protein WG66_002178 [Moniliophthora roreri]